MHEPFLFTGTYIAADGAWEIRIAPASHWIRPFVRRRWIQFITQSPQLLSYLFIDTEYDALEYLQLSPLLSGNTLLFIVLHGSVLMCDAVVIALL